MSDAWRPWSDDPVAARTGVSFDRTPSGPILAPPGRFRVCAYHVDFDERPTCWRDVATLQEAARICASLPAERGGWNVDYAMAFDETGSVVCDGR
jgi:hypothetical protein